MPVAFDEPGGLQLGWKAADSTLFIGGRAAQRRGIYFNVDRRSLLPLIELAAGRQVVVEVGSLAGFSTRIFANTFARVVSVDPYRSGYDVGDLNARSERLQYARDIFKLRFLDDPRVTQLRLSSLEAARRFNDSSLDLVYLDAGHSFEAVRNDIRAWLPKVKPGGLIAGDDYWWGGGAGGGVRLAVIDVLHDHEVVGGRWAHRRSSQAHAHDTLPGAARSSAPSCMPARCGRSLQRCMHFACTLCGHCTLAAYRNAGSPHLWTSSVADSVHYELEQLVSVRSQQGVSRSSSDA